MGISGIVLLEYALILKQGKTARKPFNINLSGQILPDNQWLIKKVAFIMETGLEDTCYALVTVGDGTASLYFSNGGGIIGAGEHEEGAKAAVEFLQFSEKFETHLSTTKTYPLPKPGKIALSPLFHKGHDFATLSGENCPARSHPALNRATSTTRI